MWNCPVCHSNEDVEVVGDIETNNDPVDTEWETQCFCDKCKTTFAVFEKVVYGRTEIIDMNKVEENES